MTFDLSKYDFAQCPAKIHEGGVLFRITSPMFSDPDKILRGDGHFREGRFHDAGERVTYCSTNALVSIAENLFEMHHRAVELVNRGSNPALLKEVCTQTKMLNVLRVREIDNLVNLDQICPDSSLPRLYGTATVHPARTPSPLRDFSRAARDENRRGVLYPSARHSRDRCLALFEDETACVDAMQHWKIQIELSLIDESAHLHGPFPQPVDPDHGRLHPTMGTFAVQSDGLKLLGDLNDNKVMNPAPFPQLGLVDFVRRIYREYPSGAILA